MNALEKTLAGIRANIESKNDNSNVEHEETRDIADNSVTKSNALARAYYRFSLAEKRVMESAISKLHPMRTDNPSEIKLSATEYSKAYGISASVAYRQLAKVSNSLQTKKISIEIPTQRKRISYVLVPTVTYEDKAGCVTLGFHHDLLPHLTGLRKHFTAYSLKKTVNFKSSYTWRFYELLMSWAQPKNEANGLLIGWITIEVEELRKIMGIPDSYQWHQFNKRALEVATKELKEKASIHVKIEQQKTVRTISHLKIEFIEDSQQQLPLSV